MSIKFGIFTPQGWRRDLNKIADPYQQYEAMTNVGRVADAGSWACPAGLAGGRDSGLAVRRR